MLSQKFDNGLSPVGINYADFFGPCLLMVPWKPGLPFFARSALALAVAT
jgi:hypothetical protein